MCVTPEAFYRNFLNSVNIYQICVWDCVKYKSMVPEPGLVVTQTSWSTDFGIKLGV